MAVGPGTQVSGGNGLVVIQWVSPTLAFTKTTQAGTATPAGAASFSFSGPTGITVLGSAGTAVAFPQSISVTGVGTSSTTTTASPWLASPITAQTITETQPNASWVTQSITCNDTNAGASDATTGFINTNTNPVAQSTTVGVNSITIPASAFVSGPTIATAAAITCTFVNRFQPFTITGKLFEDINGDLLADGAIGGAGNPGIAGRTVRLFSSAGAVVDTQTSAADGSYTLITNGAGTYYVEVDRPASGGAISEQTYASAGSGNSGTAGTGTQVAANQTAYGTLCVTYAAPTTYTDQPAALASDYAGNPANGACYGGRRGATADATGTTLANDEHVTRVVVGTSGVTAVDFGFSYNVVSNVNAAAGQGSVAQFITNANVIAGANAMRFVPTVSTNQSSGGNTWWRVSGMASQTVTSGNGDNTTIDGTAYSAADGTTTINPNNATLGTGGSVGVDAVILPQLNGPELEFAQGGNNGFVLSGAGSLVQRVAIFGSGTADVTFTANNTGVNNSVLGSGAGAFSDPATRSNQNLYLQSGSGFTVTNNLMGFSSSFGTYGAAGPATYQGNEIRNAGRVATLNDDIYWLNASTLTMTGNLVVGSNAFSIETSGGTYLLTNNTFSSSGSATGECRHIKDGGDDSVLLKNIFTNAGVSASCTTTASAAVGNTHQRVKISRNSFFGNKGNAIDNNNEGVTAAAATGGNCPSSGAANGGIPRPTLSYATLNGTTLTVTAAYCNSGVYTLEFYKVASGAATGDGTPQAGEGQTFLGSLTGLTGGTLNSGGLTVGGLTVSDKITAIAIREDGATTAGNTSEFSANISISPSLRLRKISLGGVNTFPFTAMTNVVDTDLGTPAVTTNGSFTTTVAGTAVDFDGDSVAPGTQPLLIATPGTAVTFTETAVAGFLASLVQCTDANGATDGNGTGTLTGTFSGAAGAAQSITLPASIVKAGADLTCTVTNGKAPTVTVSKVSNGGTGGFTFTGTNGYTSTTINTVTAGTAVAGTTRTLGSVGTVTDITESDPTASGFVLTGISCTGLGTGGTATVNTTSAAVGGVPARSVRLDAAATAAGSDIACTFTNAKPTVTLTKAVSGTPLDGGLFNLTISGGTPTGGTNPANNVGNGGTTGAVTVNAGQTITFAEAAGTGTFTANYTTTFACVDGNGTTVATAGAGLSRTITAPNSASNAAGAAVSCTYTNTANVPTVTPPTLDCTSNAAVFNTGVNAALTGVRGFGSSDLHWERGTAISNGVPPSGWVAATVTNQQNGGWFPPGSNYAWISDSSGAMTLGTSMWFRFVFNLDAAVDPTTLKLSMNFWSDDVVNQVYVNGVSQGISGGNWISPSAAALQSNWHTGTNTVMVATTNGGGVGGFMGQFTATSLCRPKLTLIKQTTDGFGGPFTFTGGNGWASQSLTTTAAGAPGVTGTTQTLTAASTATTITESALPANWQLGGVTCTGLSASATPTVAGNAFTLPAAGLNTATSATGLSATCTVTNVISPKVNISKTSLNGTGTFSFTQTNLAANPASITTATPGTPVANAAVNVTAIGTAVTLTETPAAGFVLTAASCSDANSAVTGNPPTFGTFSGNVVTIPAANVVANAVITCSLTNNTLPKVTISKVSNNGLGTFTFTGTNGYTSTNITTVTAGTAVAGTTRTLTAADTATDITESDPTASGFVLTGINCTGLGAGGTATVNTTSAAVGGVPARSVRLDAAATAAGSNIACTFTNAKPTVTLIKQTAGIQPDNALFNLTVSGGTATCGSGCLGNPRNGVGNGGSTGTVTVNAGQAITLTEAAGTYTSLSNYTTAFACQDGNGTAVATGGTGYARTITSPISVGSAASANITCTYTNTSTANPPPAAPTLSCIDGGRAFDTGRFSTVNAGKDDRWKVAFLDGGGQGALAPPASGYYPASLVASGAWTGPAAGTSWIGGVPGATSASGLNNSWYRMDFNLDPAVDPATVALTMRYWADNEVVSIWVNGVQQTVAGIPQCGLNYAGCPGFQTANGRTATLGSNWQAGANSLVVQVGDGGGIASFLANFQTAALCRPKLTVTKESYGSFGQTFTITGTNGWASQTFVTTAAGDPGGVTGATQTLTAASTATTLTETPQPTGYALRAAACTGLSGGANPTLGTNAFTIPAAGLNTQANAGGINAVCVLENEVNLPTLSKAFSPATVDVPGKSRLTITLTNTHPTLVATLSAALVDTLPAGVVISGTPNAATTCGAGVVTAVAGAGTVTLASGATIPAAGSCTVSVDVKPTTAGSLVNTLAVGALQTNRGANDTAASATLTANDALCSPNFNVSGNASYQNGSIRLTSTSPASQNGQAWFNQTVNLAASFDYTYRGYYGDLDSGGGGIAGVLKATGAATTGTGGAGMGYQGITPSLTLEVDTNNNAGTDPAGFGPSTDELSLHRAGNPAAAGLLTTNTTTNVEDGNWHTVRVVWDRPTNTLQVYLDGVLVRTLVRDIVALDFAGNPIVNVGFVAATEAAAVNEQRVCVIAAQNTPTLQLKKSLGGAGRIVAADQFTLTATGTGAPAPSDTTGTGSSITSADVLFNGTSGTAYTLDEAMAAGSGSTLAQYVQTVACTNSGTTNVSGLTSLPINVTPVSGDAINCTITNTPKILAVSGQVFEDSAGDLLFDGAVGNAVNPGIGGVTVRLFDSTGVQQAATTTAADGSYTFGNLLARTYYVSVDRPGTTAAGTAGVLGEQTYADSGIGNAGLAGGTGHGPLCVNGTPPTYTDNSAIVTSGVAADTSALTAKGACYGGRRGGTADTPGTTLDNNEHVTRVVLASSDVTGVDFGFGFDVVTNIGDSGQGSLRQFILNANAIGGANAMHFVPAVASNQASGGNAWWRVAPTSLLPAMTDAQTTIDGTAYSNGDGTTVINPNNATLGTGGSVGRGAVALPQLNGPEFEIKGPGNNSIATGLDVEASNVTIRHIAIYGFGNGGRGTSASADIQIGNNVTNGFTGDLIDADVVGTSAASFTDPGAGARTTGAGITISGADNGTLRNTLVGFHVFDGVVPGAGGNTSAPDNVAGWTLLGNEIRGNALGDVHSDGIGLWPVNSGALTVDSNLIVANGGVGVEGFRHAAGDWFVWRNSIIGNGTGGAELFGVRITGAGKIEVLQNIIQNNPGAAVRLDRSISTPTQAKVSQNDFGGNGGNAIDLNGDGVSLNTDACTANGTSGVNGNVARPTINYAVLNGTTLTLGASYCGTGTYQLELYKVAAGNAGDVGADGKQAGEGTGYLGELTLTGGLLTSGSLTVSGLTASDRITAIVIRTDGATTAGNTSEFSANVPINPSVLLRKTSTTTTGTFAFSVTNADTDLTTPAVADSVATITTTVAGTPVAYDADSGIPGVQSIIVISTSGTAVAIGESVTAGFALGAASCTDGTTTFTATGLPAIGGSTGTVTIPAANVAAGSNWTCDFTNDGRPRLTIRKTSLGGTGSFAFTGTNGLPAALPGVTVTTTAAGASADSAVQTLAANGVATTVIEQVPPGWTLNTVSCFDRNAAATGNPASFGTVSANAITVPAANVVTGADIVCAFTDTYGGFTVSGRVFRDSGAPIPLGTGANSGTPNDGVQNGSEAGIAGVTVSLTDCGATTYATTSTDASGDYSLGSGGAVGVVCVEEHNPTGTVSTGANQSGTPLSSPTYDRNLDRVQLTLVSGTSVAGVNFGDVSTNQLLTDGMNAGVPGSQVVYPHTFIAGTGGTVGFATSAVPVPVQGWSQVMYLDANCNAVLDGDPVLSGPITVVEGQTVCLLLVEQVPAGAANGSMDDATLTASFTFANAGPALGGTYTRHDVTTVSDTALGLTKRVRNVTQGTPFATSNQARTGDVLEYEVTFRNNGPEAIGTLVVHDATPAYTQFVSATCGAPLPAALTGCSVTQQPAVGAAGAIDWTYAGMLVPGQSGSVTYQVTVE